MKKFYLKPAVKLSDINPDLLSGSGAGEQVHTDDPQPPGGAL